MENLLYTAAEILIMIWAIAFFGYALGGPTHMLLVVAGIAIVLRNTKGNNKPAV